jgi:histidinol-phosphate aminotransferase
VGVGLNPHKPFSPINFPDMPRFRPDLDGLVTYVPGRPIDEVAREIGMDEAKIIKLASNESPEGPFPGVTEAVAAVVRDSNRYPDNDAFELTGALADHLQVDSTNLWLGAGSTGLLGSIAYGLGGPGTSVVYAWPSFVMYRIISRWSMAKAVEVPLDSDFKHDLGSMLGSITENTNLVYLCNPNNPTGTIVPDFEVREFIERLPESVVVVVDEAYHHFVEDSSYRSAIPLALDRPNVIVLRTLSKVFALASHRIGVAIGDPATLTALKRTQAPFTVSSVGQAAALATLDHPDELRRRIAANSAGRRMLSEALKTRAIPHTRSEANFVFLRMGADARPLADRFLRLGIIVRPMSSGWIRVTVGTPSENEIFIAAIDKILDA